MKCLLICGLLLALVRSGHGQVAPHDSIKLSPTAKRYTPVTEALSREYDFYANRRYSYGFSENFYGFQPNTIIYHAIDGIFSERFRLLDLGHWASFEGTGGASYQPYQGFRLHLGFDYEWLTPNRVHLYAGLQFAEGLRQKTYAFSGPAYIIVGCHSYLVPFTGVMWWPGKRDIKRVENRFEASEHAKLRNPTFWQLVFLKAQVGYSTLLSRQNVMPSEGFNADTAQTVRRNISSGLYLSIGAGINLPSFNNTKLIDMRIKEMLGID